MNITPKYVMKTEIIDKYSIQTYFVYEDERRAIRWGKVRSMSAQFSNKDVKKQHFDAPLVINEINNRKNIIDGNHRIEAIKLALQHNKDFSIKVWLAIYRDLNREQERQIYHKWNIGTTETATDYLKYYFKTIPLGEQILSQLPTSIYGDERRIPVKRLLGAVIVAKKPGKFQGSYLCGGEQTVSDFCKIDYEDIRLVRAWYKDMVQIFGEYFNENPYYRASPLFAWFKIWYDNRTINPNKLIIAFKKAFVSRWAEWDGISSISGRLATIHFYKLAIERLKYLNSDFKADIEVVK